MTTPNPDSSLALRHAIQSFVTQALSGDGRVSQPARVRLVEEMVASALHLEVDGADTGQLRLVRTTLREMRTAYRMFNRWRGTLKVSVFGSARTPTDHADYTAAREFGRDMASAGWMVTTGAAGGIMQAALEDAGRDACFGLAIRLPTEARANDIILGDPKLVEFRYFFTRKLMFLSHADAVAVFPGGFGTMDELFEALTLVQTGRAAPIPIVLVEGADSAGSPRGFWQAWKEHTEKHLLRDGFISAEDMSLVEIAASPSDAVQRVTHFYRRFHSSRFVGDSFVIRMQSSMSEAELTDIRRDFAPLCASGTFVQCSALPQEGELEDLPRLVYQSSRRNHGMLRQLINRLNDTAAKSATTLLLFLLAASGALSACEAAESVTASATPDPISVQAASSALRQSEGIELVLWSVPDHAESIDRALATLADPLASDANTQSQLRRNGLVAKSISVASLDELLASFNGSYTDVRVWHGQTPYWREAFQRVAAGNEVMLVDGRPASIGPGVVRLVFRGWTLPVENGGVVDLEVAATVLEGSAPVKLESTTAGAMRGTPVPGCRIGLTLNRGEGLLITGRAAAAEGAGPPGELPITMGEWLFASGASTATEDARRTVLLFLPAIPDTIFPPAN
ncbi:MAG: TIGR00730 family Rossman fold protein [Phycisphaerales bacterium]|nr:TIGR00730 family Rossman fold protein [Phycisphaerales bacterium]